MNLVKEKWLKTDIPEFQEYLKTLGTKGKEEWTKNILQTQLPVLAIKAPAIRRLSKEICKGNYLSFLDLLIWEYYENAAINGSLISKIKDTATQIKYLDIYSEKVDNWANCDVLSFNIKGNEKTYLDLAKRYIKSDKTFRRRIALVILFNYIDDNNYLQEIFNILDTLYDENEYYVNMISAWLVCECFVKQRDLTLAYLDHHNLNAFTINKAVQKCRDSYRVSKEDKNMLLSFKVAKTKRKSF